MGDLGGRPPLYNSAEEMQAAIDAIEERNLLETINTVTGELLCFDVPVIFMCYSVRCCVIVNLMDNISNRHISI